MGIPWLRLVDVALTLTEMATKSNRRALASSRAGLADMDAGLAPAAATSPTESTLAGVVVAALKEAFNRDHQRLEFERERMDAERRRADRLLKLELARQAGDREIGRLRLLGGLALALLLTSLVVAAVMGPGPLGSRLALGTGWACLLGALASAFTAQTTVSEALAAIEAVPGDPRSPASGPAGLATLWLILVGTAIIGLAILIR